MFRVLVVLMLLGAAVFFVIPSCSSQPTVAVDSDTVAAVTVPADAAPVPETDVASMPVTVPVVAVQQSAGFWGWVAGWISAFFALGIFHLFVFGGVGFWIYCAIWIIVGGYFARDDDDTIFALLWILILGSLAMWIIGAFNPFALLFTVVCAHPLYALLGVLGYYAICGPGWAGFKIWLLGRKKTMQYEKDRKEFFASHREQYDHRSGANRILTDDELEAEWINSHTCKKYAEMELDKETIIGWWLWWPLSVLNTVFSDLIKQLVEEAYRLLEKTYKAILRSAMSSIYKDIDAIKKRQAELAASKAADQVAVPAGQDATEEVPRKRRS